ncbi:MAG: hypothetical protein ACK4ON_09125, partial [Bacteroidia bacterium]
MILLVYWMPNERKFAYDYIKNKPWQNEVLIAPFDFAIYKNESELKTEQNSIIENSAYYFDKDLL